MATAGGRSALVGSLIAPWWYDGRNGSYGTRGDGARECGPRRPQRHPIRQWLSVPWPPFRAPPGRTFFRSIPRVMRRAIAQRDHDREPRGPHFERQSGLRPSRSARCKPDKPPSQPLASRALPTVRANSTDRAPDQIRDFRFRLRLDAAMEVAPGLQIACSLLELRRVPRRLDTIAMTLVQP